MADSESQPETPAAAQPEKPVEPTAIVKTLRTKEGGVRTALVNAQGKFVKQPKKMPEGREMQRVLRNFGLDKLEVGPDGRLTKSSKSLVLNMTENIARIAMYSGNDGKAMAAAVAAYNILMERMWGKNAPSDQELGALERAGVRVVVLSAPELMHPEELTEEQLRPAAPVRPSFAEAPFIEGTVVSTNAPQEGTSDATEGTEGKG